MTIAKQLERMLDGEPRALARLITAVENGLPQAGAVLDAIAPHLGRARVIGVTGPPGVGKSTVVSAYVSELRRRGATIGVVAIDPSSPISGGALLGDRIRMTAHAGDPGVFIRSVSARGHAGGLSAAAAGIVDLMDAAGRDVVVVETVGAGQSEVAIAGLADCGVVVMAPGLGDDVQAIKAGILEIADVLVVNKADLPHAGRTRETLCSMLTLRRGGASAVQVLETTATEGAGFEALADAVDAHCRPVPPSTRARRGQGRTRHLLAAAAAERVRSMVLDAPDGCVERQWNAMRSGNATLDRAAQSLIDELFGTRAR